jgi:hypothetical protein
LSASFFFPSSASAAVCPFLPWKMRTFPSRRPGMVVAYTTTRDRELSDQAVLEFFPFFCFFYFW